MIKAKCSSRIFCFHIWNFKTTFSCVKRRVRRKIKVGGTRLPFFYQCFCFYFAMRKSNLLIFINKNKRNVSILLGKPPLYCLCARTFFITERSLPPSSPGCHSRALADDSNCFRLKRWSLSPHHFTGRPWPLFYADSTSNFLIEKLISLCFLLSIL